MAPIYYGSLKQDIVSYGSDTIGKGFYGADQVYSSVPPTPPPPIVLPNYTMVELRNKPGDGSRTYTVNLTTDTDSSYSGKVKIYVDGTLKWQVAQGTTYNAGSFALSDSSFTTITCFGPINSIQFYSSVNKNLEIGIKTAIIGTNIVDSFLVYVAGSNYSYTWRDALYSTSPDEPTNIYNYSTTSKIPFSRLYAYETNNNQGYMNYYMMNSGLSSINSSNYFPGSAYTGLHYNINCIFAQGAVSGARWGAASSRSTVNYNVPFVPPPYTPPTT